jgi:hypothetical protein
MEDNVSESRVIEAPRTVLAWHFLRDNGRLANGDRRKVVPGRTLKHKGELILCSSGLHASVRALDALKYAPGPWLQRVECGGEIIDNVPGHTDKLVCGERKCLWIADATPILRPFARKCALDVIHLWDAPDVVRRYLETGDESISDATSAAAWAAAWDAAWAAARAKQSDNFEALCLSLEPR